MELCSDWPFGLLGHRLRLSMQDTKNFVWWDEELVNACVASCKDWNEHQLVMGCRVGMVLQVSRIPALS
jgi:hypothetical protein